MDTNHTGVCVVCVVCLLCVRLRCGVLGCWMAYDLSVALPIVCATKVLVFTRRQNSLTTVPCRAMLCRAVSCCATLCCHASGCFPPHQQ